MISQLHHYIHWLNSPRSRLLPMSSPFQPQISGWIRGFHPASAIASSEVNVGWPKTWCLWKSCFFDKLLKNSGPNPSPFLDCQAFLDRQLSEPHPLEKLKIHKWLSSYLFFHHECLRPIPVQPQRSSEVNPTCLPRPSTLSKKWATYPTKSWDWARNMWIDSWFMKTAEFW